MRDGWRERNNQSAAESNFARREAAIRRYWPRVDIQYAPNLINHCQQFRLADVIRNLHI